MLTFNFNPFPEIKTERMVLRKIVPSDADDMFRLRSDSRLMQFIDRPVATSLQDVHDLFERINESLNKNEGITWAMCLKNDNRLIGTVGYYRNKPEHHRGEIGYMIHSDFQRNGLTYEALISALNYGFNELHFHSVEADVNPDNAASVGLLEKAGFIKEAHFKENYYFNGVFKDTVILSLLARNFISK
jgi:[ribosomal protein S5]-alanine N-acetyltransferase